MMKCLDGNDCFNKNIKYLFAILVGIAILYFICNKNNKSKKQKGGSKGEFTLYYVTWCPHCKVMKPDWDRLEASENINTSVVSIKSVDCTDKPESYLESNDIEGFPTIIYSSSSGEKINYRGGRSYEDFLSFLSKYNLLN